jgi:DNA-binding response OmpR family regulator
MQLPRVLLVDDNEAVRTTLAQVLEKHNFEVVTACSVNAALAEISKTAFDVLLTDLHMPGAGDGMTVVSAMRHSHPAAVTLVFSGYPEMRAALSAILLQADEILVKPLDIHALVELIQKKLLSRRSEGRLLPESVAMILNRERESIIRHWLKRVELNQELNDIPLSFKDRTGHLPQLVKDLVVRLRQPHSLEGQSKPSSAATAHGRLRYAQGYTAALLIEESRMLQVSIFETLQLNLASVDFSLLLADVMTIADEVDSQLAQAMRSYINSGSSNQQKLA